MTVPYFDLKHGILLLIIFITTVLQLYVYLPWLGRSQSPIGSKQHQLQPPSTSAGTTQYDFLTTTKQHARGGLTIISTIDAKGFETFEDENFTRPKKPIQGLIRFENVQVSNDTITVFYGDGFQPPVEEKELNIFLWNNMKLQLPTKIIDGSSHRVNIRVKYVAADAEHPTCTQWYNTPAVLMHIAWPDNYYHTMRDGVMASFQTLRELGLLQLIRIDKQGNIQELTEGKGNRYCIDIDLHTGEELSKGSCWNYPDLSVPTKCDPKADTRCQPGVHSLQSFLGDGPVLIPMLGDDVPQQFYDTLFAMTPAFMPSGLPSVSEGNEDGGVCFKEVFLGFSSTFDAYNGRHIPHRKVARHHMTEWFASRDVSQAGNWRQKYEQLGLEELRKGVNASYIPKLSAAMAVVCGNQSLATQSSPAAKDFQRLKRHWIGKADAWYQERQQNVTNSKGGDESNASESNSRHVVTFVSRKRTCDLEQMSRDILNQEDILEYILRWYDVTLKVTTFHEPLPEVVQLLQSTDVLIGMHGAGLTNAIFIKEAATLLQMMPYGWIDPNTTRKGIGVRGTGLANIAERMSNCKYVGWHSPHADHAFFCKADFGATNNVTYMLHPASDMMAQHATDYPYWWSQNTFVDITNMVDSIDEAMQHAGIPRRQEYVAGDIGNKDYWESVGLKL